MRVWMAVRDRVAMRLAVGLGLWEHSIQPKPCLSEHPAAGCGLGGPFPSLLGHLLCYCVGSERPDWSTRPPRPCHPHSIMCVSPPSFSPPPCAHSPTGGSGLQHLPRSGPILLAPEARLLGSRVPLALQPQVAISEQGNVTGKQAREGQSLSRKASKAQGLACCPEGTCACRHPKQGLCWT